MNQHNNGKNKVKKADSNNLSALFELDDQNGKNSA